MNLDYKPEGIIITISKEMIREKGYRNWLKNFLSAMADEKVLYYMKQGTQPKHEVQYVYLCIGGRVRFRALYVLSLPESTQRFLSGIEMYGKAWVVMCGPVVMPRERIERKGFRGFRYTEKLF